MHWIAAGKGKYDLVVKPLYGPKDADGKKGATKVYAYHMPKDPSQPWERTLISHMIEDSHNFHPIDWDRW